MQRGWLPNIRSQLPRELKSCGRVYFRAPQGFSSAVRVLNLSITVGLAVVEDEGEGVGVTSSVSGKSSRIRLNSSGASSESHVTTDPIPGTRALVFPSGIVRVRTLLEERFFICFARVKRSLLLSSESVLIVAIAALKKLTSFTGLSKTPVLLLYEGPRS